MGEILSRSWHVERWIFWGWAVCCSTLDDNGFHLNIERVFWLRRSARRYANQCIMIDLAARGGK